MNNQNLYIDTKDVTTESGIDEPVTLEEVKDFLRLEGFVDSDESTTEELSNFDFDDDLLTQMITAARKKLEKWLGVSIVFHTWQVQLTNCAGDIEIPYGPIQEITEVTYSNEVTAEYTTKGFDFKLLVTPKNEDLIIEYEAGYEECPEEISLAIKQCVGVWYEERTIGGIPKLALSTASPYKRAWTWLA
jgi:hypothetical protein